jgi:hypothetical protein
VYADAPGDIYPRDAREAELCARASSPDWVYLSALGLLNVGTIALGSYRWITQAGAGPSLAGPAMIGTAWGWLVGGAWLALPKCDPKWVGTSPREGEVRHEWPLALSLALLAGATAPVVNGIALSISLGYPLPADWSDEYRAAELVVAGLTGFVGALIPYVLPPRTLRAARELERLRFGADGRGGALLTYEAQF